MFSRMGRMIAGSSSSVTDGQEGAPVAGGPAANSPSGSAPRSPESGGSGASLFRRRSDDSKFGGDDDAKVDGKHDDDDSVDARAAAKADGGADDFGRLSMDPHVPAPAPARASFDAKEDDIAAAPAVAESKGTFSPSEGRAVAKSALRDDAPAAAKDDAVHQTPKDARPTTYRGPRRGTSAAAYPAESRVSSCDAGLKESEPAEVASAPAPATRPVGSAGAAAAGGGDDDDETYGDVNVRLTMPELEKHLADRGAAAFARAAVRCAARVKAPKEAAQWSTADVAHLCRGLGFDAGDCEAYEAAFEEAALDGLAFTEMDAPEDYVAVGVRRDHAVVLVAVSRAIKGFFGAPVVDRLRAPASKARLSDAELAQLEEADRIADETGDGAVYGQLVVLGYKEYRVEGSTWHPVGSRNEKFPLRRRPRANGIRRDAVYLTSAAERRSSKDKGKRGLHASHSVTMSVAAGSRGADGAPLETAQCVTVEYVPDAREDMFQLGRMIVPQNDFVVRGPLHLDAGGVLCGPVSRYACRLSCARLPPYDCALFAAGFNNDRDIFLSEQAPKWQLAAGEVAADAPRRAQRAERHRARTAHRARRDSDGDVLLGGDGNDGETTAGAADDATAAAPDAHDDSKSTSSAPEEGDGEGLYTRGVQWDALTTFGVRIWKPEIGAWREVSVHGGIHEPRQRADVAGKRFPDEDSTLTNGTIVDLAGIQLLFESAASMRAHARAARAGDRRELSVGGDASPNRKGSGANDAPARIVARFNARRPQCPVQLHTIRLEYDDDKRRALAHDRRPYIFPACGHVHAFAPELQRVPCPLCRTRGPFVELKLEWEPAICDDEPEVTFNPCGHIVSERVARKWAALALPDNAPPNARYRPICPFCAKPLKTDSRPGEQPYNRILFQSSTAADDDDDDGTNDGDNNSFSSATPLERTPRAKNRDSSSDN